MKKFTAEIILSVIVAPFVIWFFSFVLSTYKLEADVDNTKDDIGEIKTDVKYIKNYLLERK
ncbi:MAG: hypothetical protein RIQ94_197 [Pseudomonadota bacterium]|jgi:hypothetical protein